MTRKTVIRVGIAIACGCIWPLIGTPQAIDRRIDVSPSGVLEIVNPNGEIVVTGWERNEAYITGDFGDNGEQLDVRTAGDRVIVEVVPDRGNRGFSRGDDWWNGGTDLRIRAPATVALDIKTRSADVEIIDMRGEQRIGAISGDIRTEAYAEELRLQTVSGDIRVDGNESTGFIRASAVSGDIRLSDVGGEVWAESVSGDVTIVAGTLGRADLKSVSGDIRVMAAVGSDARLDALATSGDIDLDLRGNAAGGYHLATFSGTIDACFGPRREDEQRFGPGEELRFTEGDSAARIEIRTHSGDIRLCRE